MKYSEEYKVLSNLFNTSSNRIQIPNSSVQIDKLPFVSNKNLIVQQTIEKQTGLHDILSNDIPENMSFDYPLFSPTNASNTTEVIILLHGLNERSWDKYLVWARFLCEETNKRVLLFPIAYHMNRSSKLWSNPRTMQAYANSDNVKKNHPDGMTCMNAALSIRLKHSPQQFFASGLQSYHDIISLMTDIRQGRHPLLGEKTRFHLFGYSIGALLSEVLLISNPNNLFKDSKTAFFCGGASLHRMQAFSKFILNHSTFKSLQLHYGGAQKLPHFPRFKSSVLPSSRKVWNAFLAMTGDRKKIRLKDKIFKKRSSSIMAIAMKKDSVIPFESILLTLIGRKRQIPIAVKNYDYNVPYSHENPFPLTDKYKSEVDTAFREVFSEIAQFFRS